MDLKTALQPYQTTLITGASSGIGQSFLKIMANLSDSRHFGNLSRRKPGEYPENRFEHFPCDLSDSAQIEATLPAVKSWLDARPDGPILLINNSGFGDYGRMQSRELAPQLGMIDVNARAVVHLTHALLPTLLKRGGAVMNIASVAAWQPTPFLATYGATKAFLMHWSLALGQDLKDTRVHCLAVCPGPTASDFGRRAGLKDAPDTGIGMTAEAVVLQSLTALARRRTLVVNGWRNRLMVALSRGLPPSWQAVIAQRVLARFRDPEKAAK